MSTGVAFEKATLYIIDIELLPNSLGRPTIGWIHQGYFIFETRCYIISLFMEGRESDSGKGISLTDFRAEHNEAIKKAIAYEKK